MLLIIFYTIDNLKEVTMSEIKKKKVNVLFKCFLKVSCKSIHCNYRKRGMWKYASIKQICYFFHHFILDHVLVNNKYQKKGNVRWFIKQIWYNWQSFTFSRYGILIDPLKVIQYFLSEPYSWPNALLLFCRLF